GAEGRSRDRRRGRLFFQAEDGIRDRNVTGVQTCALPISPALTVLYYGTRFPYYGYNECKIEDTGKQGTRTPSFLKRPPRRRRGRSEEHTSELQSRFDLVCRLLLEKKNIMNKTTNIDTNRT